MKLNIYTIRDKKAQIYMKPFFSMTNATAQHAVLMSMLSEPNGELKNFCADYVLYRIGTYDEVSAHIETHDTIHVQEVEDILLRYLEKKAREERERGQQEFAFKDNEQPQIKMGEELASDHPKLTGKGKAAVQAYADNNGKEPSKTLANV